MNKRFLISVGFLCFAASGWHMGASVAAEEVSGVAAPKEVLGKFFSLYCNDCHGGGADEGGLDLDSLGTDLSDAATLAAWERIFDRVRVGEMPPEDSDSVPSNHRAAFAKILGGPLYKAHTFAKGTVFRRLNRGEYENTMNDLFGTRLDLASFLPEDGRSHEFDNVGEALSVSEVHLQQYLNAADQVLSAVIEQAVEKPEKTTKSYSYADTREGKQRIGKLWKKLGDGSVVFFNSGRAPGEMIRGSGVKVSGLYKVRLTGYAHQSDEPVTFSIGASSYQKGTGKPIFGYRSVPPGKPTTVEVEAWIDEKFMIAINPWGIGDKDNFIRKNGVERYDGPGLAIQKVEVEGPLVDEFPSRGYRLLFDGLNRQLVGEKNRPKWKKPEYVIQSARPRLDATRALQRVATAAFRRPATPANVARYVDLFESQMQQGETFEQAYLTAVSAIFCSPDFLYLLEPEGWLDDHAIASRLSYFLTRTTPDEELLAAADAGRLAKDPATLLAQTRRLIDDPRNRQFVVDFTDAWLNLRDINFTSPDQKLFPEYDLFLQNSMLEETREFFHELIRENLPVTNVVKSDFAMLNNRLALHYGIDGVRTPEIHRVSLPANSVRGGILGQGSVLKVSANGTNTSPVVRGVWVMERIVGQAPPPPPPGVPGVEPDIRGATTLRELLDKHRSMDSCRGCHSMIDPPGFALESFNPVGGWRDRFRSLGDGESVDEYVNGRKVRYKLGPPVDASGQLPSGTQFKGFVEFRELLASQDDLLARMLASKLMTFATGRELGFSDREVIEEIVTQSKERGHGVRDLIELVVTNAAFRRK